MKLAFGQFEQSGHGAYACGHGILHELAARANEPKGVSKLQAAVRNQGGVFAEAMSGDDGRVVAQFGEDAKSGNRRSKNGGLGIGGLLEFFLRAFKTQFGEREPKSFVSFCEGASRDGKFSGQTVAHAGELRALAWEKESEIRHEVNLSHLTREKVEARAGPGAQQWKRMRYS
jgi:hypothetical protein